MKHALCKWSKNQVHTDGAGFDPGQTLLAFGV